MADADHTRPASMGHGLSRGLAPSVQRTVRELRHGSAAWTRALVPASILLGVAAQLQEPGLAALGLYVGAIGLFLVALRLQPGSAEGARGRAAPAPGRA